MNLENYEFIERVSGNTTSETWMASKQDSKEAYLIKALHKKSINTEDYNTIIQNANKAKELRHTNLVNILEIIEQDECAYLVSENVTGDTIKKIVKKEGVLMEKTALAISLCVAGMLETAHRKKNLSHGSISPSNIIINKDGTVKLAGMGLYLEETIGFFTAPEKTNDKDPDAKADMYSLGTTIYFMLTSKESFNASEDGFNTPEDSKTFVNAISEKTTDIITKLTHTTPKKRYTDWKETINDIKDAISALPKKKAAPKVIKINKTVSPPKQSNQNFIRKTKTQAKVPLWFRALAWLALLLFLGWFTHRQLTNPLVDKNNLLSGKQNIPHEEVAATEEEQVIPIPEQNPEELLSDTTEQVVSAIFAKNIDTAKNLIINSESPVVKKQSDKLLKLIDDVFNPDLYITGIFANNIGQEMIVVFGSTRRAIIPITTTDVNITVKLAGDNDSEPVTFSLKELPTEEKLRLLANQTDETAYIIKLLLNLKAGNTHEAKILAKSCGIFADSLSKQLNRK